MASEKRKEKIKAVVSKRESGLVVVIEDIHDPHNAEAIFRTCDALGVQEVYLIFDKEPAWNPRRIGKQSSSSANKWLTFHIFRSTNECLSELQKKGYFLVATTLTGKSSSLFNTHLEQSKLALLVGNEHRGLSTEALHASSTHITIPMTGMVESLNVSVATALFLYEIVRQRKESGNNYCLSNQEQNLLVDDFLIRSSKRKTSNTSR